MPGFRRQTGPTAELCAACSLTGQLDGLAHHPQAVRLADHHHEFRPSPDRPTGDRHAQGLCLSRRDRTDHGVLPRQQLVPQRPAGNAYGLAGVTGQAQVALSQGCADEHGLGPRVADDKRDAAPPGVGLARADGGITNPVAVPHADYQEGASQHTHGDQQGQAEQQCNHESKSQLRLATPHPQIAIDFIPAARTAAVPAPYLIGASTATRLTSSAPAPPPPRSSAP
jgi:hypothetical protein